MAFFPYTSQYSPPASLFLADPDPQPENTPPDCNSPLRQVGGVHISPSWDVHGQCRSRLCALRFSCPRIRFKLNYKTSPQIDFITYTMPEIEASWAQWAKECLLIPRIPLNRIVLPRILKFPPTPSSPDTLSLEESLSLPWVLYSEIIFGVREIRTPASPLASFVILGKFLYLSELQGGCCFCFYFLILG